MVTHHSSAFHIYCSVIQVLDARPTALTSHSLVHSSEDQINIWQPFPKSNGALMLRLYGLGHQPDEKLFLALHWEIAFHVSVLVLHVCFWVGWEVASAHRKVKIGADKLLAEDAPYRCTLNTGLIILTKIHYCPVSECKLWYFSLTYGVKGERMVSELWICLFWSRISRINWKCLTFPLRCTLGM